MLIKVSLAILNTRNSFGEMYRRYYIDIIKRDKNEVAFYIAD